MSQWTTTTSNRTDRLLIPPKPQTTRCCSRLESNSYSTSSVVLMRRAGKRNTWNRSTLLSAIPQVAAQSDGYRSLVDGFDPHRRPTHMESIVDFAQQDLRWDLSTSIGRATNFYIVLKQECILIVACQGFHHVTQHQNFFDPALCFFAALTRASRFFPFKLPSFLFLSLKLPSWFLQFIEVVVRTSGDRKSPDRRLKFSWPVYLYSLCS